jgi:hypothetical protein
MGLATLLDPNILDEQLVVAARTNPPTDSQPSRLAARTSQD